MGLDKLRKGIDMPIDIHQIFVRCFGEGSDHEQAALIGELSQAVFDACRADKTAYQQQLYYIAKNLDVRSQDFIFQMAALLAEIKKLPELSIDADATLRTLRDQPSNGL